MGETPAPSKPPPVPTCCPVTIQPPRCPSSPRPPLSTTLNFICKTTLRPLSDLRSNPFHVAVVTMKCSFTSYEGYFYPSFSCLFVFESNFKRKVVRPKEKGGSLKSLIKARLSPKRSNIKGSPCDLKCVGPGILPCPEHPAAGAQRRGNEGQEKLQDAPWGQSGRPVCQSLPQACFPGVAEGARASSPSVGVRWQGPQPSPRPTAQGHSAVMGFIPVASVRSVPEVCVPAVDERGRRLSPGVGGRGSRRAARKGRWAGVRGKLRDCTLNAIFQKERKLLDVLQTEKATHKLLALPDFRVIHLRNRAEAIYI